MKKTKVIIPALGILLLSTAASVTGTVAWFSMNTVVEANNMQVKAQAQQGIVIANTTGVDADYKAAVAAYGTDAASYEIPALQPASTWNLKDWYFSKSDDPTKANNGLEYTKIAGSTVNPDDYYVSYDFYIRSSTGDAITGQSLTITSVVATSTVSGQALSNALRVGVLIGDEAFIYSPVRGTAVTYNVRWATDDAGSDATAHTKPVTPKLGNEAAANMNGSASLTIPANSAQGQKVSVYLWFEGEDEDCKSENLVASNSLDNLTVKVSFGHKDAA